MSYPCREIACSNKVTHPGQFCAGCEQAYREDEKEDDEGFDPTNPDHLCIKCGREAIVNGLCGMCSKLYPNLM